MEDEKKKKSEYVKNWTGGMKDAEKFASGFKKASEMPDDVKKAWEALTGLFVPKARASKK